MGRKTSSKNQQVKHHHLFCSNEGGRISVNIREASGSILCPLPRDRPAALLRGVQGGTSCPRGFLLWWPARPVVHRQPGCRNGHQAVGSPWLQLPRVTWAAEHVINCSSFSWGKTAALLRRQDTGKWQTTTFAPSFLQFCLLPGRGSWGRLV